MSLTRVFLASFGLGCGHLFGQASGSHVPVNAEMRWYRGNTHAHTSNSDGNLPPEMVARWYATHGYQFLVLSDHDLITDVAPINSQYNQSHQSKNFLVIQGEEITQRFIDGRQAHVNAINLKRVVLPWSAVPGSQFAPKEATMSEVFARNFSEIVSAGGIPQVNHPNYRWSIRPGDLIGLPGPFLLEIWNACDHNVGGTDESGNRAVSTSELWDILLTRGTTVWGVASDDAHDYRHLEDVTSQRPGLAWIVARASELSEESICNALRSGDFYASTGVVLEKYSVGDSRIEIAIKAERDARFTTQFIGREGKVLSVIAGLHPGYSIKGDEGYVRAEIKSSLSRSAWTQPVILRPKR
jgi:hypothetical protein